jgi:molybdate transport repressor ModE-like protein
MKAAAHIRWHLDGVDIEPRLVRLLEAVARHGKLREAAAEAGVSYRHAWGLLEAAAARLGSPLVTREQGRGSRLAPLGTRLLEAMVEVNGSLAAGLRLGEARMMERLERLPPAATADPAKVTLYASHDLALARVRDLRAADGSAPALELQFHGSLDCLIALRRGQCEIAGFHLPAIPGVRTLAAPLLPLLERRDWRAARLFDRTQGLMVRAGNPRGLRRLADLARGTVRFVNRQPGSGTRLCFDFLLAQQGLSPAGIHGYTHEEFTHAAVAATVASGMADAAFGIEAAAREHGLDFVPLVGEHYYLAARAGSLRRPGLRALLAYFDGRAFRRLVNELAGYRSVAALQWVAARDVVA